MYKKDYEEMLRKVHRCCKVVGIDLGDEDEFINICNEESICSWKQFVMDICDLTSNDVDFLILDLQIYLLKYNMEKVNEYILFNLDDKRYMLSSIINMIEENGDSIINLFNKIEKLNDYKDFFIIFLTLRTLYLIKNYNFNLMLTAINYSMNLFRNFSKYKQLINIIGEDYFKNLFLFILNKVINEQLNVGPINLSVLKIFISYLDTYKWLDKNDIYKLMKNEIYYKEYAKIDEKYLSKLVLAEIENENIFIS